MPDYRLINSQTGELIQQGSDIYELLHIGDSLYMHKSICSYIETTIDGSLHYPMRFGPDPANKGTSETSE